MFDYEYRASTRFNRVCLEISLKPFGLDKTAAHCEDVARTLFDEWAPLLKRADGCSVLLWTSDGSEILDYAGNPDDTFEWCRYIGLGNWPKDVTQEQINSRNSLHIFPIHYMENPPEMTYGDLKAVIAAIKRVGKARTGFQIEVGETFDPGPEFAWSAFKFERHPEIASGDTMGAKKWVHCASRLHADTRRYAAYPDGIPEGTHLGEFLGRQFMALARDVGFDYLWLSNGFGFSLASWNWVGELFDGERFDFSGAGRVRGAIEEFWEHFSREVGKTRIETRGSNLSTGMDISAHGCPIDTIYRQGIVAPPNSPWAPLNHRFGLELAGYLSHIAELPEYGFQMRYYIHDPWWLNSPWFDRYDRSPHDIYLPLSAARLDETGRVTRPGGLALLSADDSFGRLPARCPNEVIPHLLAALDDHPDEAGLVTWVYPFDAYCKTGLRDGHMERIFMDDWLIESAIDQGFPINTVISDKNFIRADKAVFRNTILVLPVPEAGSKLEDAVFDALNGGLRLILFGTTAHASEKLQKLIGVRQSTPLEGELTIKTALPLDEAAHGAFSDTLTHLSLLSGGGITEAALPGADVRASVYTENEERAYATVSGNLVWIRGSFPHKNSGSLPEKRTRSESFIPSLLLRAALAVFGYEITFLCDHVDDVLPVLHLSRCRRALWLNGYAENTTVRMRFTTPDGAPAFDNTDFFVENDVAAYPVSRWFHTDCRVFIRQKERSHIRVQRDCPFTHIWLDERIVISGLKDASVTVYAPEGGTLLARVGDSFRVFNGSNVPVKWDETRKCFLIEHVTGTLNVGPQEKEHIGDWKKLEFLREPDAVTEH